MQATEKRASLCEAISGTINKSDFARFEQDFGDEVISELLPKTASVLESLGKLLSVPPESGEAKLASAMKIAEQDRFDVLQVLPDDYGYVIKWAAAPDGTEPKEKKVSKPEAQKAVPKEMLDTADQQGAATVTDVQADPDPLAEQPQPIQGFGMYKVYEAGTSNQIVGFVIPGLYDPRAGGPTQDMLFTNGSSYAIQPSMTGVLVNVSYNLPKEDGDPRGLGVFYKTDGRAIIATIPFNVVSRVTIEGQSAFSVQTTDGMEVQITPSEGLQKPLQVSPQEIAIPADFTWLPLNNEVAVEGDQGQDVMTAAKQAAAPTMMEVRAWANEGTSGGGCVLSGPVFEKNGSGTYDWVDGVFWMAAAGVPQNVSVPLLEKAASTGQPLRLYGCQPLEPARRELKEAAASAVAKLASYELPERKNLLREAVTIGMDKQARALVGVDSVDNLLAINFINPENVETFVDYLPELENTASKLASLVFATQLGLQAVSKTAATRAMQSMEDVIQGLRSLKKHRL